MGAATRHLDSHRLTPACGGEGRAARCAAAPEDFDDEHTAATARAWRAMIRRVARIGGFVHHRGINRRHRGGDQLPGARNIGLAAGTGEEPVVANAMKPFWQDVEQEAPDELVGAERHCAVPRLPIPCS